MMPRRIFSSDSDSGEEDAFYRRLDQVDKNYWRKKQSGRLHLRPRPWAEGTSKRNNNLQLQLSQSPSRLQRPRSPLTLDMIPDNRQRESCSCRIRVMRYHTSNPSAEHFLHSIIQHNNNILGVFISGPLPCFLIDGCTCDEEPLTIKAAWWITSTRRITSMRIWSEGPLHQNEGTRTTTRASMVLSWR